VAEANKNASTNPAVDEDEFYDDATESFPSVDDLVGGEPPKKAEKIGRLVAIWPLENGVAKKSDGSGTYPYTNSVTLVLDDGPDGDLATDLVGSAPVELQLRHSTSGIQSRLAPRVDGMSKPKRNEDGEIIVPAKPLRFIPMIGRVNTRPSTRQKNGSPAFSVSAPTDADREIIAKFREDIKAVSAKLREKAEAADADDFE
jgi:hypothetical protein